MDLIILGASARAAAFSAHRAGLRPWCVDLFGDADLARAFPVRRVPLDGYPHALLDALADAPDGPVLYTGGLENYPELIARIERPLWGNPPEVLRRVRSPFLLTEVLRRHGLPVLDVRSEPPALGDGRQWLLKPLRGSGGVGIRLYHSQSFDPAVHYLQEYVLGHCFGTVFLGIPGSGTHLLGTTWQIVPQWLHLPPFHYGGSLVPQPLTPADLRDLGDVLAREFALAGLFSIDTVFRINPSTSAEEWLLLEVNPRYTASVEVLERVCGRALLDLHRAVYERRPILWQPPGRWPSVAGKAVLYARQPLAFPETGPWRQAFQESPDAVSYADIPHAGEVIPRGRPVLTLFASGATDGQCLTELRRKAEALDRCLYG